MASPSVETKIWRALSQVLETLPVCLFWPGQIVAAEDGKPHGLVSLIVARPVANTLAQTNATRDQTLQILIRHKPSRNPRAFTKTTELAGQVAAMFPAKLIMEFGGVRVVVQEPPHVADGYQDGGWWVTPVRVRTRAVA